MLMTLPIILITFFSQTLEYVLGFGGTLVALVIGSYFYPVNDILYLLVPINILLNLSVIYRDREFIDYKLLLLQVIPWMILGFSISIMISASFEQKLQIALIGGTLVVSAVRAILSLVIIPSEGQAHHQSHYRQFIQKYLPVFYYMLGGFAQAAMGAGGPFVTFQMASKTKHHQVLRGTLACLWLIMNLAVLVGLLKNHNPGEIVSFYTFMAMLFVFPFAIIFGEKTAKLIPSKSIPLLIQVVLLMSGISLISNYFRT
jgi:uncharacterized membrane protein YfcA